MQEIHPWLCLKQVILLMQDYRNLHLNMCATNMKQAPHLRISMDLYAWLIFLTNLNHKETMSYNCSWRHIFR